jgi:hypothetical protein
MYHHLIQGEKEVVAGAICFQDDQSSRIYVKTNITVYC